MNGENLFFVLVKMVTSFFLVNMVTSFFLFFFCTQVLNYGERDVQSFLAE